MVDSRNACRINFDAVSLAETQVLGTVGQGADLLDFILDVGRVCLSAEMLGIMQEAFDRTIEYLKTRQQFGVLIGTYQALQHRAVDMFCEREHSQSLTLVALRALDDYSDNASALVSAAKARTSDAANLICREAIQMFGGIGMTDEEDIGLFMKRARVAEITLGDGLYHRDRFARLSGF